jgi:hypothetical protein
MTHYIVPVSVSLEVFQATLLESVSSTSTDIADAYAWSIDVVGLQRRTGYMRQRKDRETTNATETKRERWLLPEARHGLAESLV